MTTFVILDLIWSFVDVVVNVNPQLWNFYDGIAFVILEHFWDLVHCLLIPFCFGSEILKKIGLPQPPKKTKPPKKDMDILDGITLKVGIWYIFVSTKFHFDETISLAGLVS